MSKGVKFGIVSKCQLTHDGKVLIYGDTVFKCAHTNYV